MKELTLNIIEIICWIVGVVLLGAIASALKSASK